MKLFSLYATALASALLSNAVSVPAIKDIAIRDASIPDYLDTRAPVDDVSDLYKRKGGGGKGGSSGGSVGGSSGGSSSGGSRPASGGSSSSSGSGSSGSRPATGGGTTPRVAPSFGGGRYYGGGATTAYRAGSRSRGVSPLLIASPLLLFPGLWLAGAYAYNYNNPYRFYNRTATNSSNPNGENQTKPVECLCAQYQACGCDNNTDSSYLNDLVGNGSYAALNKSVVNVADVNGTSTIVINGTLPNSTTDGDSSSGSSSSGGDSGNAGVALRVAEWSGYWIMAVTVLFTVWA